MVAVRQQVTERDLSKGMARANSRRYDRRLHRQMTGFTASRMGRYGAEWQRGYLTKATSQFGGT
jgi:hypothetical protein